MSVKKLLNILVKKIKLKLKKKEKDTHLEYLQICQNLRESGMISVRELYCVSFISEDSE